MSAMEKESHENSATEEQKSVKIKHEPGAKGPGPIVKTEKGHGLEATSMEIDMKVKNEPNAFEERKPKAKKILTDSLLGTGAKKPPLKAKSTLAKVKKEKARLPKTKKTGRCKCKGDCRFAELFKKVMAKQSEKMGPHVHGQYHNSNSQRRKRFYNYCSREDKSLNEKKMDPRHSQFDSKMELPCTPKLAAIRSVTWSHNFTMARSNRNVTSAKPGSCPMNKKLRNAVLDELITTHEQNPNKRRGDIARIVEASQEEYPYVTRDNFNNRWRALKKQRKEAAAATNSTENSAGSSEGSVLANAAEGDLNSAEKAGRKKGSTDAAKLERTQQEMEALHWVTMKCKESKDRNPKKMKSGTIDHLITSARSKFKLPPMWNPSKETIRTRLKKKIHVVNPKRGPKSPVPEAVERTVVEIACESNRCGRPLDTSEIIDLANDLIKGQPIEKDIIDWQIRFCPTIRKRFKETKERPTSANLGPGWYQGFRQRNPEIATAKAINHDERRASWCKYGNMSDMFGMIYKRLKEAGHAKELPTPQWQDLHGNVVSEKEAYGHRVEYYLTHSR
ncbi:unnamed protein product [Cylindrotheca closterium]|uniref:Uncharacterized protein n=1 Tax=Cylindrotheca closterium TaxID=2856 RepID=A0AAD2CF87_9STRA|nr:unnamed protein product [Cylindrotheca closterium]CAJ1934619.1 unnamed protein product [Cylindrotheca closterium]